MRTMQDSCTPWMVPAPSAGATPTLTNDNPDYLHADKEHPVSITPGELRARLQPTILLRMTAPVAPAPGNTDVTAPTPVFTAGMVVFAQYIGNGRLVLTPVRRVGSWGPQVVMASALNTTSTIITDHELSLAFTEALPAPKPATEVEKPPRRQNASSLINGQIGGF